MRMRRKYKRSAIGLALGLVTFGLAACGNSGSSLPDLSALGEIRVIAREEGSGTRAEFESLVGTDEKGTDQIALSTEEAESLIAEDENAIGYLAFSSVDTDRVKLLSIGGSRVDENAIRNNQYPLCRNYYVAYSGEPDELTVDFLTYVMSAGQGQVADFCIPVNDPSHFLSDRSSGTVTVVGSTSVAPLMRQLAEDYMTYNPNASVLVEATDSTSGLTAAIRGECDLAMSSRSLKDYEAELLEYRAIAYDAIAVAVHPDSPLTNLSVSHLKGIYNGDFSMWSDVK
ncbi:MAG: substrate-binding domain-containing protein [Clostridiales bacterium]|nr:substrate-binding domain-containing protein [Clostridiales bacterium]